MELLEGKGVGGWVGGWVGGLVNSDCVWVCSFPFLISSTHPPTHPPTYPFTQAPKQHVGLKNQGATCYMNSLLQQLYHIPEFRAGLLSIDLEVGGWEDRRILVLHAMESPFPFVLTLYAEEEGGQSRPLPTAGPVRPPPNEREKKKCLTHLPTSYRRKRNRRRRRTEPSSSNCKPCSPVSKRVRKKRLIPSPSASL